MSSQLEGMPLSRRASRNSHFRPDIEGLRAVAVLLVIGSHFAIPGLFAGFIGVDIFFVISGYLITSILVREHENTGKLAIAKFYASRLRRLFPALAVMLVITSILALKLLPDDRNLVHSQAAAMAAFWISNIYFAFADVDYFGAETSANAFLHTWSLGVEEQFYLVWPLLILAAARWIKGKTAKKAFIWLFFSVAALSLGACLLASQKNPTLGFYMMPTRAWQFAAGALVWLISREHPLRHAQATMTAWSGVLLLFAALFLIGPQTVYPGVSAVLPTLGTCALLYAGAISAGHSNPALPTSTLLSLAPMQTIGRLSYAWYLWHWPVLVIGEHLLNIKGDASNTLLAIALSLLAAILTHHLVENPIRYGRPARVPYKWQIATALFAMLLLNSQLLRWNTYTQELVASAQNDPFSKAAADIPVIYKHGCDDWYYSAELKPCEYGRSDAPKTAVLLGDSIGAQWFPTLTAMLDPEGWKIIVLTKSSCPMVDELFFYQRIGREFTECSEWRNKSVEWLAMQKIDRLFIGGTASSAFTDAQWQEGTHRLLERLSQSAATIYLIEANPTLGFHGPNCLSQHRAEIVDEHACVGTADNTSYARVATLLESVTGSLSPNAHWIKTRQLVCPDGKCQALRNGMVIFRDSQHLTASFTASVAADFLQQIQRFELTSP